MSHSNVASLFGASLLFVAAGAHAQVPPLGGAQPPPAPPAGAPLAPVAEPVPPPEATKPAIPQPDPLFAKWTAKVYGYVELDIMHDSTQSFGESVGATVIQPESTYAGSHGRTHFTARNSRLGIRLTPPELAGMKTTAVLEMDFFGSQPPGTPEAPLVSSGTFRMRQAHIKLESDYIDVLVGQFYHLFAWQPYFFPSTTSFFPVMNQAFGRMPQLRVSRTLKTDPINVDIAVAALKPPQRDSEVPDLQAGLRFGFNGWKGIHVLGAAGMLHDPLTIGVSGAYRHFRVTELSATPIGSNTENGYGLSVDAMIPVIPASSLDDAGNALTLTGSFFTGEGIGDLVGVPSGVPHAALPDGTAYVPNIDNGLVTYDAEGNLRAIDWHGFMVGAQYYLPPSGRFSVAANYTQGWTDLISAENGFENLRTAYKKSRYMDASVFADITPAFRVGLSFQHSTQTFANDETLYNERFKASFYSFF